MWDLLGSFGFHYVTQMFREKIFDNLLKLRNEGRRDFETLLRSFCSQLNTEWAQVEVINLINDGSGLGFGIIGGRSTGVVVKTILPGGVADRVSKSKS